nr:MerR family transcriptional regulator [uncultured Desulfobacter sp.]
MDSDKQNPNKQTASLDQPKDLGKGLDGDGGTGVIIRKAAELTGVKPVTLRAWERRYHLITPERNPKGHRLYSPEQIDTIREICRWLERGVSIGKVKSLLSGSGKDNAPEVVTDTLAAADDLLRALADLNSRRAEEIVNRVCREYPPKIAVRQCFLPVIDSLGQLKSRHRSVGRALLQFLLISRLSAMIRSENKSASIPCLAVSLDPPGSLAAWLWLVSMAGRGLHITLLDGVEHISGLVDHSRLQNYEHLAVFANRVPTKQQQQGIIKLSRLFDADHFHASTVIETLCGANLKE